MQIYWDRSRMRVTWFSRGERNFIHMKSGRFSLNCRSGGGGEEIFEIACILGTSLRRYRLQELSSSAVDGGFWALKPDCYLKKAGSETIWRRTMILKIMHLVKLVPGKLVGKGFEQTNQSLILAFWSRI